MKRNRALWLLGVIILLLGGAIYLYQNSVEASENIVTKAYTDGKGVWLEWKTVSENEIVGFRVYRHKGKEESVVTPGYIAAANLFSGENAEWGRSYSYFDPRGDIKTLYSIEILFLNGTTQQSQRFRPTRVKNLEEIAGTSSEELLNRTSAPANPFVYRENLEIPADVEIPTESNFIQDNANFDTQRWIAAQPGVKIGIKQDGIYRISRSALQSAGFDVNAPVERWQLYTDGVEQPIRIIGNGEFIEFYGRGIDINETDTRVYYLIVGNNNGRRIENRTIRAINGKVLAKSFQQSLIKRDSLFYINSILNGSRSNFFGALVSASGGTINVNIPSLDPTSSNIELEVSVQGFSYTEHSIRVLLNDTQIGMINGMYRDLMTANFILPTSMFNEGNNTIKLIETVSNSNNFIDQVKVTYNRRYRALEDKLLFYTQNYKLTKVDGFSSQNILLYDITYPNTPRFVVNPTIESNSGTYSLVLPSSRAGIFYAATESSIQNPVFIRPNVPSTLSSPNNAGKLIIISHANWMTEAENWANYRRSQGITVKVVNVEDIFDEFDFGLPTGESIRRFLQYAKTNWTVQPDYVLLLGDATFDPRNYTGNGFNNFVPTMIVDTTFMETGSDEALADFDDDGLAEIPIGRIATRSASVIAAALAKTMSFEQGINQAFSRGGLFPSDLPQGYDFEALNNRLIAELPSSIPVTTVNRSASDARDRVIAGFNNGPFLVNYSGHGTFAGWAGSLFTRNDVSSLNNTNNNLIIVNVLTCLNGYYVEASQEGLAEALVNKSQGGAVASWASSALTTPDVQETMALRFYRNLRNGPYDRIGDLIKDAKTAIPNGRDVRLSWELLGDPMLKVRPSSSSLFKYESFDRDLEK